MLANKSDYETPEQGLKDADDKCRGGDYTAALEIWERLRQSFPDSEPAHFLAADTLRRQLARLDDAENIIAAGLDRFGERRALLTENARIAHQREDWPEASSRWARVRDLYPEDQDGWLGGSVAVRNNGNREMADQLAREACQRFPEHPSPIYTLAWAKLHDESWGEAISLWAQARELVPNDAAAWLAEAYCLSHSDRAKDAEALLNDAVDLFPQNVQIALDLAAIARARTDWPAVLRYCTLVRSRFPDRIDGWVGVVTALNAMGRYNEARPVLASARARFPDDAALAELEFAETATASADAPTQKPSIGKLRGKFARLTRRR